MQFTGRTALVPKFPGDATPCPIPRTVASNQWAAKHGQVGMLPNHMLYLPSHGVERIGWQKTMVRRAVSTWCETSAFDICSRIVPKLSPAPFEHA
jgi:hypothetical protein